MKMKQSKGAAIIIVLLVLIVGATSVFVNKVNNTVLIKSTKKTTLALKKAKQALIDYAVTYYYKRPTATANNRYGFLPCPQTAASLSEGLEAGNCGAQNVNAIGKLPWRTLGIQADLDSDAECLWYAVSGLYKNGTSPTPPSAVLPNRLRTEMLNEDSNGSFQIHRSDGTLEAGNNAQDRVVAVIIAPQQRLGNQNRTVKGATDICSPDNNAADFLDNFNGVSNRTVSNAAVAIDDFIAGDFVSKDNLNDRVITITKKDIFDRIVNSNSFNTLRDNTLQALAQCLLDYSALVPNRSFPWPAPLDLVDYTLDSSYDDMNNVLNRAFGRYPLIVTDSLVDSGKVIADSNLDTDGVGGQIDLLDQCALRDETLPNRLFWKHWKDHFYYAVGNKFRANGAAADNLCGAGDCLTVNGAGAFNAIVIYSGSRLSALSQIRNASPPAADADTKLTITNYLEGRNDDNPNDTTGVLDYESNTPETNTFNDKLYCIDAALNITAC